MTGAQDDVNLDWNPQLSRGATLGATAVTCPAVPSHKPGSVSVPTSSPRSHLEAQAREEPHGQVGQGGRTAQLCERLQVAQQPLL